MYPSKHTTCSCCSGWRRCAGGEEGRGSRWQSAAGQTTSRLEEEEEGMSTRWRRRRHDTRQVTDRESDFGANRSATGKYERLDPGASIIHYYNIMFSKIISMYQIIVIHNCHILIITTVWISCLRYKASRKIILFYFLVRKPLWMHSSAVLAMWWFSSACEKYRFACVVHGLWVSYRQWMRKAGPCVFTVRNRMRTLSCRRSPFPQIPGRRGSADWSVCKSTGYVQSNNFFRIIRQTLDGL